MARAHAHTLWHAHRTRARAHKVPQCKCRHTSLNQPIYFWLQSKTEFLYNFFYVSRFGLAVRLVSGRTSVRYRFGSPFSSKRLWFVDTDDLVTLSITSYWNVKMALIAVHLNAGHSGGDRVAIGIYSPLPPSLISLTVSVDVKHHVVTPLYPLPPPLPVPNKLCGFCGR